MNALMILDRIDWGVPLAAALSLLLFSAGVAIGRKSKRGGLE